MTNQIRKFIHCRCGGASRTSASRSHGRVKRLCLARANPFILVNFFIARSTFSFAPLRHKPVGKGDFLGSGLSQMG